MAWLLKQGTDFLNKAKDQIQEVAQSDFVEKAREAAREVAEKAKEVTDTVQAEYRRTFEDLDCQIFKVQPDVFIMEYPSVETLERLAKRLNEDHSRKMLIFDFSEKEYDTRRFEGEVVCVALKGSPVPPLRLLCELCLSACQWLASDPSNVLVVHCFSGYCRSAFFVSCLLAFRGFQSQPKEALKDVCALLPIDNPSVILPSQQRYLAYFQQCLQGPTPEKRLLRLSKVILSAVPLFETEGTVAFRPFLEVSSNGALAFSSLKTGSSGKPDDVSWPASYGPKDPCVSFQLPQDLIVEGDVVITVRHVFLNGAKETALCLAFHTGLTPNGLQLTKRELDGARDDQRFHEDFFIDLVFEDGPKCQQEDDHDTSEQDQEENAVFDSARELSRRLCEEEQQRRDSSTPATGQVAGDEDVEALEATLMRSSTDQGSADLVASATKSTSGAVGSSGDEELKKALAEASQEDGKGSAAVPSKASTQPTPVPAQGSTPSAQGKGQAEQDGETSASKKSAGASIDSLFDEFDAALSTAGAKVSSGNQTAGYNSGSSKPTETSAPKASAEKKDVMADVDDFLKELDSGLKK